MRYYMISLGCPKNAVDAEGIGGAGDILLGMEKWETLNYDNVTYVLDHASVTQIKTHLLREGDRFELTMPVQQ